MSFALISGSRGSQSNSSVSRDAPGGIYGAETSPAESVTCKPRSHALGRFTIQRIRFIFGAGWYGNAATIIYQRCSMQPLRATGVRLWQILL